MDKQTEHLSFRCTPEFKARVERLALARGISVSQYLNECAVKEVEREHQLFLELSRAFCGSPDLPGLPCRQEQAA